MHIEDLIDKTNISYISKKAQLYTLFCVVFEMLDKQDCFESFFEKIKIFINAYSSFRNEFVLDYDDSIKNELIANIKKYKLASSEGINKVANRTIRYEILYNYCVDSSSIVKDKLKELTSEMDKMLEEKKSSKDSLELDDMIDED